MDITQFAQLGGVGLFAFFLLRHTLAQSAKLSDILDNHLRTHSEVLTEIRDSLKTINYELHKLSTK